MKVLKFEASWCSPCKMLKEVIKNIETDVVIESVDIDENIIQWALSAFEVADVHKDPVAQQAAPPGPAGEARGGDHTHVAGKEL